MVRSTKAPKKRTATVKKKSNSSSLNLTNITRSPRMLLFAVAFALVGVYLIIQAGAKPTMLANADEVVAAYYKSAPTMLSNDVETGDVTYISSTSGYALLADGTLLCDDGNTNGTVKTGKVGLGIVKQLHGDISNLDLGTLPNDIKPTGVNEMVSNNEGFILADSKTISTFNLHADSPKPDKLVKMQALLEKLCANSANSTQERGRTKQLYLPRSAKSSARSNSVLERLASAFSPKVEATSTGTTTTPYTATIDGNFSNDQAYRTNNYRAQNRLHSLARGGSANCVNDVAHNWAKYMAQNADFKHNPNLLTDMNKYCGGAGFKYNTSDPNKADGSNTWTFVGENVGVTGSGNSEGLFNAYVASTGHRNHLLANGSKCMGHGTYKSSNGNWYHAFVSAAWVGGPCQR